MQLYALLQFPHWEAHSSSLPPHPQRSTWCQRGLWQSQDLLLLCCSHQASLRGLLIHCFTGLHQPSHLWLPEKHCHHLSAAWGSQGKAKGGAPMAFCLLTLSKWALKLSWMFLSSEAQRQLGSLLRLLPADAHSTQLWDPHSPGPTGLSCRQHTEPGTNDTGSFLSWNDRNAWSASNLCTEFYQQSIIPPNALKAIKAFLFFNKLAF